MALNQRLSKQRLFFDGYLRQSLANHTPPNVVSEELALKHQTLVSENTLYRYIEHPEGQGEALRKDLPRRSKHYYRSVTVRPTIENRVDTLNVLLSQMKKEKLAMFED
uniref:hypothetical protein n=1 Tax=Vibrio jasicida TaxID=766224 RepID=UPI000CE3088C|nr:hypothetical protein [Vibrio jasicida]